MGVDLVVHAIAQDGNRSSFSGSWDCRGKHAPLPEKNSLSSQPRPHTHQTGMGMGGSVLRPLCYTAAQLPQLRAPPGR